MTTNLPGSARRRADDEIAPDGSRHGSGLRRVDPEQRRGPVYRGHAWLSASRPFAWVAQRIGWKLDPVLLRLTEAGRTIPLVRLSPGPWDTGDPKER